MVRLRGRGRAGEWLVGWADMDEARDTIEPIQEKVSRWRWLVVLVGYGEILAGVALLGSALMEPFDKMYFMSFLLAAVVAFPFLILPGKFLLNIRGWRLWLSQIPPITLGLTILTFRYVAGTQ